jgi:hypothetical protein
VQSLCLFWVKGLLDADTDTASVDCRLMQNVVLSASPACPLPAFLYDCRFVNRLGMSLDVGFQYSLAPFMLLYRERQPFVYAKYMYKVVN